jgi:hypothetical protein
MKCQENKMKHDFLNSYVMKTPIISHWAITEKVDNGMVKMT